MEIIPAIYILDGHNVALYKGDINQKEVYRTSPLDFAKKFVEQGAKTLFIVDLNATLKHEIVHEELLKEIAAEVDVKIIYGGGIRTIESLEKAFELGMNIVVLGVSAQPIYSQAISTFGADNIMVGIRAKDNEVVTDMKRDFPLRVIDFADTLAQHGVTQVLYKDIMKEGTQIHPNYDVIDRLIQMTDLTVYASGGIGKPKHLKLLKEIGTTGALIGKALYKRALKLPEIIQEFSSE